MDNLGSVIFSGGGIQDMVGGIVNADGTQFGGLLNGLGLTQSIDFLNNVDSNIIGNISQVFAAGGGVGNIVGGILNSGAIDFGGMLSSLGLDQATSFLSTLDAGIIGNIGQIFLSGGGVENIIGGVLSGGAIDFGGMLSSLGLGEATNFLNGLGGDFINNIGGILSGGGVSDIISGVLGSDGFNFGGLLGGLGLDGAADFLVVSAATY
jgi:hypothetical protein